jgi:TonB family protein
MVDHVNRHWAYHEFLVGASANIRAEVVIKIKKDGTILEHWFMSRSGNERFDQSVERAIQKMNPVPPLPPGYPGEQQEIILNFRPPKS